MNNEKYFLNHEYFVLLSACTIFAIKAKIGGASELKMNKFILYFSRLALSLQQDSVTKIGFVFDKKK